MENDRYVITKKVNVAKLPDPAKKQATIPHPDTIIAKIERSAQEVHEAYMNRIKEIQTSRLADQEASRLAALK